MLKRVKRFFQRFRKSTTPLPPPVPSGGTLLRNFSEQIAVDISCKPYPIRYALDDNGTHFPEGTATGVIANWLKDAGRELEAGAMLEGLVSSGYFCLGFWIPHTTQSITFVTTDSKLANDWRDAYAIKWNGYEIKLFVFPVIRSNRQWTFLEGDAYGTYNSILENWKEPEPEELQKDREFIKHYLTLKVEPEPKPETKGVG